MTDLITIITLQYKQEIIKFTVNMTSAEFGLDYGYMKVLSIYNVNSITLLIGN